jgi:hypothetical protein
MALYSSWNPFSSEFQCRGCGCDEAYQSRPRGFFESHILPIFFLQTVRCDRCYLRSYVSRSLAARPRIQFMSEEPERPQPESHPADTPNRNSRVA